MRCFFFDAIIFDGTGTLVLKYYPINFCSNFDHIRFSKFWIYFLFFSIDIYISFYLRFTKGCESSGAKTLFEDCRR